MKSTQLAIAFFICLVVAGAAGAATHYIKADGTGDYPTIGAAMAASASGDSILLAAGIFTGAGNKDIDFNGKAVVVSSESGRDVTTIDCESSGRAFYLTHGEGPGSVLSDLTIANGHGSWVGGALRCDGSGSSPTIEDCVFRDNYSAASGGAAYFSANSYPSFTNCWFENNSCRDNSGAVQFFGQPTVPTFENCTFVGNYNTSYVGNGCLGLSRGGTITGCLFIDNYCPKVGGAISGSTSNVLIDRCVFIGNSAGSNGGAIYCKGESPTTITNCTLYGSGAGSGGGVYCWETSVVIENTVIANGTGGGAVTCSGSGTVSLTCCDLYGNAGGDYVDCVAGENGVNGNISEDPQFCDPGNHDLTLHCGSPCVDGYGCGQIGALGMNCGTDDNVVFTPAVEYLNNASPTKTIDVDYLGGASGLMYGYSVRLSWDGAVVTTFAADVTEGNLLSDEGDTWFEIYDTGPNEIQIDCVLLGTGPGVAGPGTMFSIDFTGAGCGQGDVEVTVLKARDEDNQPLTCFFEDDGLIGVDMVTPGFNINGPVPDGQCYSAAPVLDLAAGDAVCGDLDDAAYRVDGGAWTSDAGLFTDYSGNTWANPAWMLPGFGVMSEGPHLVEFYCTDDFANSSTVVGWSFVKDTVAPPAVADFDAAPGHEKVHLTWVNPTDPDFDHVVIVRRPWGPGAYPEYVQPAYGYPANIGDGVEIFSGTGEAWDDPVADRCIYFYRAFVVDCAGNTSGGMAPGGSLPPQFAQGDRATNYWLADITNAPGFTGTYDGLVDFSDVNDLTAAYWSYSPGSPPGPPHNEVDFGPTDDGSRLGLPLPDDYIDFEDLMVLAMNYGVVTPLGAESRSERREIGPVTLRMELRATGADRFEVAVVLGGNSAEAKGVRMVLSYDSASFQLGSVSMGEVLQNTRAFFTSREVSPGKIWIDMAALGMGEAIRGSGEIITMAFAGNGAASGIDFVSAEVRGTDNETLYAVDVGSEGNTAPVLTMLTGARPNPFTPETAILFAVNHGERVRVDIFDTRGRMVRALVDEYCSPGGYSRVWDGRDSRGIPVRSGVYFVRMRAGDYGATSKIVRAR